MPLPPFVWCFLVGGDRTFPVDIDETQTVGHLKRAIKEEMYYSAPAFDLTLYQVAIDQSHDRTTRISKLKKLSEDLHKCTLLDEQESLDVLGTDPPPGQTYFILVQLPGSESFSSGPPLLNTLFTETLERRQDSSLGSQAHTLSSSSLACGQHALMRS